MEQVIAYIGTAVLGLAFVVKRMNYLKLGKEAISMVDDVLEALADGKLTEEEVKRIASSYETLKAAYKVVKNK